MLIKIRRSSVCLADDITDHEIEMDFTENQTFSDIIHKLQSTQYFPNMGVHDVAWVLECDNQDLITLLPKNNIIISRFVDKEPSIGRWKGKDIFFRYYTNTIERAKHIFYTHNGQKFHIWHEGFMKEYDLLHIDSELEQEWLEDLKNKRNDDD